ncbi:MAG: MFS transporter [Candidatus Marinimicrobia bacterium]|nr:MFS transporter [Candidatus Neomarinimicrobiota bacterium]
MEKSVKKRSPWWWIPTLYYAEGLPYAIVMYVTVVMYKKMGVSNADIALYTSWLYLPWVIKPFWSPIVDVLKTKRFWVLTMQFIIGAALGSVALTLPLPGFFKISIGIFWLMAFSSATHDIAADGLYMIGLDQHQQAWFVGIRSTFYRLAMLTGQGLVIILAGLVESNSGLDSVNISVYSDVSPKMYNLASADEIPSPKEQEELAIIIWPQEVIIDVEPIKREKADSIMEAVKAWNLAHGQPVEEELQQQVEEKSPSWWKIHVSNPLKESLKRRFGEKPKPILEETGNVGVAYFYLNKPPAEDEEVIVTFGRNTGSKNVNLIEGTRFVFTRENWDKPAMALFQLDPKLDQHEFATFEATSGNILLSWVVTFIVLFALFIFFAIYHVFMLPKDVEEERKQSSLLDFIKDFFRTFKEFFTKDKIGISIAFLLLYRLGESQLVKLAAPFMLDAQEAGGLGLTTQEYGFIYGTIGLLMLTLGGILGGFAAAKHGLKHWIWWMAIAMNIPNAAYIFLSTVLPTNTIVIASCVALEQFGYGFGFTAYMLYMISVAEGKFKTAHYAICTGFMALGMMIPGMISGWIQEIVGYQNFFIWVLLATIPGFILIRFLPIDPEFGKKKE